MADLFTGSRKVRERPSIIATYDYVDRDGTLVAQKVRFATKEFGWRRPDADARGGWRWGLDGTPAPALYRWSELEKASLVFVVEGEKAVDRLHTLDLVATCGPAGASTWKGSSELLDTVSAAAVIAILPDRDQPGERHAERVAADLVANRGDRPIVVKVIPLSDLPASGDVVDWLDKGHTREDLRNVVDSSADWSPGAAEERRRQRHREGWKIRKRRSRENRRMLTAETRPLRQSGDAADRHHDDRVAAALEAVLAEIGAAAEPLSGRQLKGLLEGRHGRNVIDDALRRGRNTGTLTYSRGAHRTWLYRAPSSPAGGPDIRPVTDRPGHWASVPVIVPGRDTESENFAEQNAVSRPLVTRSRVTPGERASTPLQEDSSLNTPRDRNRDTERGIPMQDSGRKGHEVGNHEVVEGQTGARATAIAAGRCCGLDGSELRCQLCRWSAAYSPTLRSLRESGRDSFDAGDRSTVAFCSKRID